MKSEGEIRDEIENLRDFLLKYDKFFIEEGIHYHKGKISALEWVIYDG